MALRECENAIVEGWLTLGDQLSEVRLSNMLGISKTPVREALQELRREGLVQIDPQRGTSTFLIENAEIEQISDFAFSWKPRRRSEYFPLARRRLAERCAPSWRR